MNGFAKVTVSMVLFTCLLGHVDAQIASAQCCGTTTSLYHAPIVAAVQPVVSYYPQVSGFQHSQFAYRPTVAYSATAAVPMAASPAHACARPFAPATTCCQPVVARYAPVAPSARRVSPVFGY